MSQRLIQPGLNVLGTSASGAPIYALHGGAPDPTDPDDPTYTGTDDDDDSDDDEDEDEEDEKPKAKKKAPAKKGTKKPAVEDDEDDDDDEDDEDEPMYTAADMAKVRARMKAADKRAGTFEAENARLKAGGRKPADVETESTKAANDRAVAAEERAHTLALQNAFYRASTVDWIDPDDALRLVDLSNVDVDEDGTVDRKALARELKALAKRKPHLVKPAVQSDDEDDDDDEDEGQRPPRRTAPPKLNGKRKGKSDVPDKKALANRFPALNRLR